eukprot:gb/GECH01012130.1/.p1 GENE.gb/GECH01012130.1/~~gb/GECH01012130.1/.p1  ORF type:complete len:390 (+),score=81.33 gb/GECH01012130.1/:1-1170(+)
MPSSYDINNLELTGEDVSVVENDEDNTCKLEPGQKGFIMHVMSQLRPGVDLTRVTIPSYFLEPRSLLEKLTDFLAHADIAIKADTLDDPLERFLEIVRWYVSGWHVKPKGVKKPYNPVLGEMFQCYYDLPNDNGKLTYLAEQVSHHPPVSAFYGEATKHHITYSGHYYPKSKFTGNSAASVGKGCVKIHFERHNETYTATWPSIYARGILLGTLLMEMGDDIKITSDSGYSCDLTFKTKGIFGGEYSLIDGKVKDANGKVTHTLKGKWNEVIKIKNRSTKKEEEFFNVKNYDLLKKKVVPEEMQEDRESRKLWTHVTDSLNEDDIDQATNHKAEIEERQRAERRELEQSGEKWTPRYFKQVTDELFSNEVNSWKYLHNNEYLEHFHRQK